MADEVSQGQRDVVSPERRKELLEKIEKGELTDEEREEILDRVQRRAMKLKYQYGGCGQTPFIPLAEEFDFPDWESVLKSLTFTGYGLSAKLDCCAALLAGYAALGMWAGRTKIDDSIYPDPERMDETTGNPATLERLRQFYDKFKEEYGECTSCRDIQGELFDRVYDLGDPKDKNIFIELYSPDCAELVGTAARMAAETILDIPRR